MLAGEIIKAAEVADVTEPVNFTDTFEVDGLSTMNDYLTISPTEGASALSIVFNHGYEIYADNTGAGTDNTRMWFNTPDNGQVVIGPRAGGSAIEDLRLRTDATTASAANMFIDATSFKISRSTSSLRYKQDVRDCEFDLDALRSLRVVRFRDKREAAQEGEEAREYCGVIAEEVHALGLTDFVTYLNGEPDAVEYPKLVLGAIQLITAAENRVAVLEKHVADLTARITDLEGAG